MAIFGSPTGPVYCLGRINVAVAGTPAPLSQNVALTTAFGTSTTPSTVRCNQIIFKVPGGGSGSASPNTANTGAIYVCYKGGNRTISNSIIVDIQILSLPFILESPDGASILDPTQFVIDADNNNDGCRVTLVMST